MTKRPRYDDVTAELIDELEDKWEVAMDQGEFELAADVQIVINRVKRMVRS